MGLPVGSTGIKESDGTAATVRYAPVGENLLSNGTFETNTTGWSAANGATLTRDTGTYKIGAASLKVARSAANTGATLTSRVTVYPGVRYVLSLWAHAATSSGASALVRWYDSGGSSISTTATNPATSTLNGWAFLQASGEAPPAAASADVELSVATSNHCFFDAITLQACVPVVESPYTEPTTAGNYASGSVSYNANGDAAFLGDCAVYDMAAQTDGTLAASSYTRVYAERHNFVGDTLLDNGLMRVWLKRGYGTYSSFRASVYANSAWQSYEPLRFAIGDTDVSIRTIRLLTVSRALVVAEVTFGDDNVMRVTLRRGISAVQCRMKRVVDGSGIAQVQLNASWRHSVYNASTVLKDHTVTAGATTVAGSSLTEPYVLALDVTRNYWGAIVMQRKPTTLYHGAGGEPYWYMTSAGTTTEREFWFMLVAWPWLSASNVFFYEAESGILGGATSVADATASGGNVARFDAQNEYAQVEVYASRSLPLGDYTFVARAKDSASVANDLTMAVRNETDALDLVSTTKTLTGSYAYYTANFTIDADDAGDQLFIRAFKTNATANNIDVDYFLIIPRKRNSATPTHVWFPYDVARNALMDTTQRESVRRS